MGHSGASFIGQQDFCLATLLRIHAFGAQTAKGINFRGLQNDSRFTVYKRVHVTILFKTTWAINPSSSVCMKKADTVKSVNKHVA